MISRNMRTIERIRQQQWMQSTTKSRCNSSLGILTGRRTRLQSGLGPDVYFPANGSTRVIYTELWRHFSLQLTGSERVDSSERIIYYMKLQMMLFYSDPFVGLPVQFDPGFCLFFRKKWLGFKGKHRTGRKPISLPKCDSWPCYYQNKFRGFVWIGNEFSWFPPLIKLTWFKFLSLIPVAHEIGFGTIWILGLDRIFPNQLIMKLLQMP